MTLVEGRLTGEMKVFDLISSMHGRKGAGSVVRSWSKMPGPDPLTSTSSLHRQVDQAECKRSTTIVRENLPRLECGKPLARDAVPDWLAHDTAFNLLSIIAP